MASMITTSGYDTQEIYRSAQALIGNGQVTELRALDATMNGERYAATLIGYFDDPGKLVEAVAAITSAKGVYIVPNPVNPALLSRVANRIKRAGKGEATGDKD